MSRYKRVLLQDYAKLLDGMARKIEAAETQEGCREVRERLAWVLGRLKYVDPGFASIAREVYGGYTREGGEETNE